MSSKIETVQTPRRLLDVLRFWLERADERSESGDIAELVELRALLANPNGMKSRSCTGCKLTGSYHVDVEHCSHCAKPFDELSIRHQGDPASRLSIAERIRVATIADINQEGVNIAEGRFGSAMASLCRELDGQHQGEPSAEQCEAGCQAYMKADGKGGPFVMHPSSMGHAYKAMRVLERTAPVSVVMPERLAQILKFLEGAENLDGYWFGEPGPHGSKFWWRAELRKALTETNLFAK